MGCSFVQPSGDLSHFRQGDRFDSTFGCRGMSRNVGGVHMILPQLTALPDFKEQEMGRVVIVLMQIILQTSRFSQRDGDQFLQFSFYQFDLICFGPDVGDDGEVLHRYASFVKFPAQIDPPEGVRRVRVSLQPQMVLRLGFASRASGARWKVLLAFAGERVVAQRLGAENGHLGEAAERDKGSHGSAPGEVCLAFTFGIAEFDPGPLGITKDQPPLLVKSAAQILIGHVQLVIRGLVFRRLALAHFVSGAGVIAGGARGGEGKRP